MSYGQVTLVEEHIFGSVLSADAATNDPSIFVEDWSDFDESGTLQIDGTETYTYTALDDDTGEITLGEVLVSDWDADTVVTVFPITTERLAYVTATDSTAGDEALPARVPSSLYGRLPLGSRDGTSGEMVELHESGEVLVVADVIGEVPQSDPLAGTDTTTYWAYEEFLNGTGSMVAYAVGRTVENGTGAVISGLDGEPGHPGIIRCATGTTAAGYTGIRGPSTAGSIPLGLGRTRVGWLVRVPTASDGTNRFAIGVGFNAAVGGTATKQGSGAYFYYKDNVNSGQFQAVITDDGANSYAEDTGVTLVESLWYLLEVELDATGTIATFFINGVETNQITTADATFPTYTSPGAAIEKTLGTTSRTLDIDLCSVRGECPQRY